MHAAEPQVATPAAAQPAPSVSPTPATAPAPNPPASVRPSLTSAFSIKATTAAIPTAKPHVAVEVAPLTQEALETYWRETAAELGLEHLLSEAIPRIGEKTSTIEIDAQTVSFHDEFKSHSTRVMELLRKKSGMGRLVPHVNPMFVTREQMAYSPDNKYKAMLEKNPAMAAMRNLFPQIER